MKLIHFIRFNCVSEFPVWVVLKVPVSDQVWVFFSRSISGHAVFHKRAFTGFEAQNASIIAVIYTSASIIYSTHSLLLPP